MPVKLDTMREIMLPGLREALARSYVLTKEQWAAEFFAEGVVTPALEVLPAVSLPVAAAMGAAAVVIKNPVVERRSLFAWLWGCGK